MNDIILCLCVTTIELGARNNRKQLVVAVTENAVTLSVRYKNQTVQSNQYVLVF